MTKTKKEQRVYMIDTTFDDLDIPKFDDKRTDKIFMEISEKTRQCIFFRRIYKGF